MSFLSCIGKKSKKKKSVKNEPLDRKGDGGAVKEEHRISSVTTEDGDKLSTASTCSVGSCKKALIEDNVEKDQLHTVNTEHSSTELQAEVDRLKSENKLLQEEARKTDDSIRLYFEDARRLEANNYNLKTRLTRAEAEAARLTVDNQKLLQKIVGMEENQAMMSRAELHSMIAQLEEAEQKSSSKMAAVLSGIRTNPADGQVKRPPNQVDRQISFRLTKAEARLSQTEDENLLLRADLKDMLDSHAELQLQLITADTGEEPVVPLSPFDAVSVCSDTYGKESMTPFMDTQNICEIHTRLALAELDQKQLSQDYINLQESYLNLQTRLQCAEERNTLLQSRVTDTDNENKTLREKLASHKTVVEQSNTFQDSDGVVKRLDTCEVDQIALQYEMTVVEGMCEMLGSRLDTITVDYDRCKVQNENLTNKGNNQRTELEKTKNELNVIRESHNRLLEENKDLQQRLYEINTTKDEKQQIPSLEEEIAALQQKYDMSLQRLEEVTKSNINGNHTTPLKSIVCTASPTDLAERFRHELYVHDWAEAYAVLTERLNRKGRNTIQILLEICTEAYLFCKRAARNQIETMVAVMTSPTANPLRSGIRNGKRNNTLVSSFDKLPEDIRNQLVHFRSNPSPEMIKSCTRDFLNQIDYDRTRFLRHVSERELNEIMTYIQKCCELCWCMVVQDTPMYLLFKVKHGMDVDRERFDKYGGQGQRGDFVVWPAVLADETGPCLRRGIMQTLADRR